jgi:lipid-A-disaccharide synthase
MARFAKKNGITVYYYISPKIWAWKESRIHKIKARVDQMFVIFPFEVDFYARHDFPVVYEGNPLIDAVNERLRKKASFGEFIQNQGLADKPIVAILPGSRKQEIDRNLGEMIRVIRHFPDHQYVIAGAPSIEKSYYERYLSVPNLSYVHDQTYELLSHSRAALITSGTATLEAALFDVPQVVCYKANVISYHIARHFVKVPYISLVNLNMQREVVKELIQDDMNDQALYRELERLLYDREYTDRMRSDYGLLRAELGGSGASRKVAEAMYSRLQNKDG